MFTKYGMEVMRHRFRADVCGLVQTGIGSYINIPLLIAYFLATGNVMSAVSGVYTPLLSLLFSINLMGCVIQIFFNATP